MPRKRNRTCSNLTQATQKMANGMAGICHMSARCTRCLKPCLAYVTLCKGGNCALALGSGYLEIEFMQCGAETLDAQFRNTAT